MDRTSTRFAYDIDGDALFCVVGSCYGHDGSTKAICVARGQSTDRRLMVFKEARAIPSRLSVYPM